MTLGARDRMSSASPEPESGLSPAVSLASRTALSSILGYAELLITQDDGLSPHRLRMLEAIEYNAHRLHAILTRGCDDPVDEPSGMPAAEEDDQHVDIGKLIGLVRAELLQELTEHEPDVTVRVPAGLLARRTGVTGLRLVTRHLLENAIKYSWPRSPVDVHAQRIGDLLSLRITDSGMGIPADEHEKVFERFYRTSAARERQIPGQGVGLTMARDIVLRQGGEIHLRSSPSVGTTVSVVVPIGSPVRMRSERRRH